METDPPPPETSETRAAVWPPAPAVAPPVREARKGAKYRTLTPHVWLDLVLGLPAGLLGAALLYGAVTTVGNAYSEAPGTEATSSVEMLVFGPLTLALCVLVVLRRPFFGGSLTLGAMLVLFIAGLFVSF